MPLLRLAWVPLCAAAINCQLPQYRPHSLPLGTADRGCVQHLPTAMPSNGLLDFWLPEDRQPTSWTLSPHPATSPLGHANAIDQPGHRFRGVCILLSASRALSHATLYSPNYSRSSPYPSADFRVLLLRRLRLTVPLAP